MHGLSICRRLPQTYIRCPRTGLRAYSFAAGFQKLLDSFDTSSSATVPPIIPATRLRLKTFHRDVQNTNLTTAALTREYNYLHKHSSIRALPKETGKIYLARLLKQGDINTATRLLLDYDLGDAVDVAKECLAAIPFFEREASLFVLWRGLQETSQKGLAYQIMVESGMTAAQITALKKLLTVQERAACATREELADLVALSLRLCKTLRNDSSMAMSLDAHTAHRILSRALELKDYDMCLDLCRQNTHATEAIVAYLRFIGKEDRIVRIALNDILKVHSQDTAQRGLGTAAVWLWLIERVTKPTNIQVLADSLPIDPVLRKALALKAGMLPEMIDLSIALTSLLPKDDWGKLLHTWAAHVVYESTDIPPSTAQDKIRHLLQSVDESDLLSIFAHFFEELRTQAAGHLHDYTYEGLMYVLRLLESFEVPVPIELRSNIDKIFFNRPVPQVLGYCELNSTGLASIQNLLEHHLSKVYHADSLSANTLADTKSGDEASPLHSLEPVDTPIIAHSQLFADVFLMLSASASNDQSTIERKCSQEILQSLHEFILVRLLKLNSTIPAINFMEATRHIGYQPAPELSSSIIRKVLRGRRELYILLVLYKNSSIVQLDYVEWARCIMDCALTRPVLAMESLQIMIGKGFKPDARLFRETMVAISTSPILNDHAAFRYLQDLFHASRKFMIVKDTILLASFLNVVLIRRGLAVDTRRIAWLLRLSEQILRETPGAPVTQEELIDVLHRWTLYVQANGLRSSARPKRLLEIIEALMALSKQTGTTAHIASQEHEVRHTDESSKVIQE